MLGTINMMVPLFLPIWCVSRPSGVRRRPVIPQARLGEVITALVLVSSSLYMPLGAQIH